MRIIVVAAAALGVTLAGCETHNHYHYKAPYRSASMVLDPAHTMGRPAPRVRRAVRRHSRPTPLPTYRAHKTAARSASMACLSPVRIVGPDAWTQRGAMIKAERAWRAMVTHDHGQRFAALSRARDVTTSCSRASANESVVGKAGEKVVGSLAVRDRCEITARPCEGW